MLSDEQAVEILKLVDGKTGVAAIVDRWPPATARRRAS